MPPFAHLTRPQGGTENIRSVIGWTVLAIFFGFVLLNAFLPNNDVNIALDTLIGVMAVMAIFYYGGRAAFALWIGSRKDTDYLIVGITISWISQEWQAWLRVVARLGHFDPTFLNSELFALPKMLTVVAIVLHVIPKGAADGTVPQGNKAVLFGFFGVAAMLAVGVLVVRPDPKPMIERMPGWTRDFFRTGAMEAPGAPPKS